MPARASRRQHSSEQNVELLQAIIEKLTAQNPAHYDELLDKWERREAQVLAEQEKLEEMKRDFERDMQREEQRLEARIAAFRDLVQSIPSRISDAALDGHED